MRLREIDFLRGMAILLVLFRHHPFIPFLHKIGWIGVDLFFVLSGFLVSGLLFQEYRKFNSISPGRFLIRRGFKIYPLFYLYLAITLFIEQVFYFGVDKMALLSDFVFIQNYRLGIWPHTWSLAVEEHFYFALPFLVLLLIKTNQLQKSRNITALFLGLLLLCLLLRFYTASAYPYHDLRYRFATHLRADSLLFGVLVSYFYYFRRERFLLFFQKRRKGLYFLSALLLAPVFVLTEGHPFIFTMGITLLYTGFGMVLSLFIADATINQKLNRLFGGKAISLIAFTGYCSYAIYLFHFPLTKYVQELELSPGAGFLAYFLGSIIIGIVISKTVEHKILKLKDKWYPKSTSTSPVVNVTEKAM